MKDARCQPGAYVRNGKTLYCVMRLELAPNIVARVWLEDAHSTWLEESKRWHHQQRWFGLAEVCRSFLLVRPAPKIQVPDTLPEQTEAA